MADRALNDIFMANNTQDGAYTNDYAGNVSVCHPLRSSFLCISILLHILQYIFQHPHDAISWILTKWCFCNDIKGFIFIIRIIFCATFSFWHKRALNNFIGQIFHGNYFVSAAKGYKKGQTCVHSCSLSNCITFFSQNE